MEPNPYIESLVKQNKLGRAVDPNYEFPGKVAGKTIGKDLLKISGPCSVESREQIVGYAKRLAGIGIDVLRGGAYKPCTYPIKEAQQNGWKEGLREKGLELLAEAREASGLPILTEVLDVRDVPLVAQYTDLFQVGMRNFQNYGLLDELGKQKKPVILKRGSWGTVDEILGACERVMHQGNMSVMICLRGVIGMPSYRHVFPMIRWAPDLMMIPALKALTRLPVIYDPSHSTGHFPFVGPIARAAVAAGADGLAIESHPDPRNSISDASQALGFDETREIFADCLRVREALSGKGEASAAGR